MQLHSRYFAGFILGLFIVGTQFSCVALTVLPQFVTQRVNNFMVREEVASLSPEDQKEGWILDQLDRKIGALKKSNKVEPIQLDPRKCWDLLVPEPSNVCMEQLDSQLKVCNAARNVSEWHNKLDNLQTFVQSVKHPDSDAFYLYLPQVKKNPLKKILRARYVVPVLTAVAVIGYLTMKKLGIKVPFFGALSNKEPKPVVVELPEKNEPFSREGKSEGLPEGKNENVTLPATTIPVKINFTNEDLKKTIKLAFMNMKEIPDKFTVTVNGQVIIDKGRLQSFACEVTIPAGQEFADLEIYYEFEWNTKQRLEKYGRWEGAVRKFLKWNGIPDELLNQHIYGKKIVKYRVTRDYIRDYKSVNLHFAGWEEKKSEQSILLHYVLVSQIGMKKLVKN